MSIAVPLSAESDAALVALIEPIRRVAAARGADAHMVDDVVQETLLRMMTRRSGLEDDALLPYALVTARNLVATAGRDADRSRRHAHRLVDLREPERPEDVAVREEEERALTAALAELSPEEREILIRHEVAGEDTASVAARSGGTSGGVAARLARTRAKLRVDFLLQLRQVELPTARCRPVLLALSAGDRRRQRSLGAGRHLLTCGTCTALSPPLLERRRGLAGLLPWLSAAGLANLLRYFLHSRKAQVASASVVIGTAAVVGVAAARQPANPPPSPPSATTANAPVVKAATPPGLTVSGRRLLPLPGGRLTPYVGSTVSAVGVPVLAVDADEGFWIGTSAADRVWVQLQLHRGGESPDNVKAGDRVNFRGVVVANAPAFARTAGVTAAEGASQLTAQGAHIAVNGEVLRLG